VVVGETVDRIDVAGGRVHGVTTARDRRFAADVVVTCAGPAADAIARLAAASLPLVKVPGLVAVARADAIILNAILMAPGINVRPVVGGPLKLHSYDADALIQGPAPGLAAARELLRSRAATLLPRPQPVKFLRSYTARARSPRRIDQRRSARRRRGHVRHRDPQRRASRSTPRPPLSRGAHRHAQPVPHPVPAAAPGRALTWVQRKTRASARPRCSSPTTRPTTAPADVEPAGDERR
jgi:glycine/D-amino acid oxidase-like deaminating enzyme